MGKLRESDEVRERRRALQAQQRELRSPVKRHQAHVRMLAENARRAQEEIRIRERLGLFITPELADEADARNRQGQ